VVCILVYNHTPMKTYEDLYAWKYAMELIEEIYVLTSTFPSEERFGLTSQMRRAANSVAANIAEGFGRYTYADKAHKYVIARGECTEVDAHLLIAVRVGLCSAERIQHSRELANRSGKLISGLIQSTRKSAH